VQWISIKHSFFNLMIRPQKGWIPFHQVKKSLSKTTVSEFRHLSALATLFQLKCCIYPYLLKISYDFFIFQV